MAAAVAAGLVCGGPAFAQFGLVKDINPGSASSDPGPMLEYTSTSGAGVYFAATTAAEGRELWASGGWQVNTNLVIDINPGPDSSDPTELTLFDGLFYFAADDGANGRELWVSDGTDVGTTLAADINAGPGSSNPEQLVVCGDYLFFTADNGSDGVEVFRFDGTTATMIADIHESAGSAPTGLFSYNGLLFFSANDGDDGQELYVYDSATLTLNSFDINPGSASSTPEYFAGLGSQVVFAATRPTEGRELWKYESGSVDIAANINAGTADSNPQFMTTYGSEVLFSAVSGNLGEELWRYNGTTATIVEDLATGNNKGSNPVSLKVANNLLFFGANVSTPHNPEPFVYNGTAITSLGKIGSGNTGSFPAEFAAVGSSVYFAATVSGTSGREPWVTQGAQASTANVQDINPGMASSNATNLTPGGGGLFMSADDGVNGTELWALSGTVLAVELAELSASAEDEFSNVTVSWTTSAEIDNVGFHVYRGTRDGLLTGRVTTELIPAEATAANGASYSFVDPEPLGGPLDIRVYFLADVSLDGTVSFHGPVPVRLNSSRGSANVEGWVNYN